MERTENKAAIYSAHAYVRMLALHSYQSGQTKSCSLERVKTFCLVVARKSWLIISLTEEAFFWVF